MSRLSIRRSLRLSVAALALASFIVPELAQAYSTRVHILVANKIREELVLSGDGTVPLYGTDYRVKIPAEDARVIVENIQYFRAGAVGPDNTVFPLMTDASHASGHGPFEQCQMLYDLAITDYEKAYALGCFLHGATDSAAHHYVNFMTGETFTLNPITHQRQEAYTNVVRHIVAESMIQEGVWHTEPEAFTFTKLVHLIPKGFVLRAYYDLESPLWQFVSHKAVATLEAERAANPTLSLPEVLQNAPLAPYEHIVLTPVYLKEAEKLRPTGEAFIRSELARMQDRSDPEGAELKVTAGADGVMGTGDDDTACTVTCPQIYATYFTYVGLLAPRKDGQGQPLPSAYEKISGEMEFELGKFKPALMDTVENFSQRFNEPVGAGGPVVSMTAGEVDAMMTPMTDWSLRLTTIDYTTLVHTILPDWASTLERRLQLLGINLGIGGIIKRALEPFLRPIRDAISNYVTAAAKEAMDSFLLEWGLSAEPVRIEYDRRLAAIAHPDLADSSVVVDHYLESGLYYQSYNIAAVAMAEHQIVLPTTFAEINTGAASFDASHTLYWTQAHVCDYLQPAIFPYGTDIAGLLTVDDGTTIFPPQITEDSPVECHDGALDAFADLPSAQNCADTDLDTLLAMTTPTGSITRSYPPGFGPGGLECLGLVVEGLPGPQEDGGAGTLPPDSCFGCSSQGQGGGSSPWGLLALGLFPLLAWRRQRRAPVAPRRGRALQAVAALALSLGLIGCPPPPTTPPDGGTDQTDGGTDGGSDGGTTVNPRAELIKALDGTVWHGDQTRSENGKSLTRQFQLEIQAVDGFIGEIKNPWGPGRARTMYGVVFGEDGKAIDATVISPPGWEIPPDNGRQYALEAEVVAGTPRTLKLWRDGALEEYSEGALPEPTDGLLATAMGFPANSSVDKGFCNRSWTDTSIDYTAVLDFVRGRGGVAPTWSDYVAGAKVAPWVDISGGNNFAISNVHGFDLHGGTTRTDQFNFVVRYQGYVDHPGASLWMRERDDVVEDGLWVFLDNNIGSSNPGNLFLEVHGLVYADKTADEVSASFAAGLIPIEVILIRCDQTIKPVHVEVGLGAKNWQTMDTAPTAPELFPSLFPPLF